MKTVAFTGYRPEKMPFTEDENDELYMRFREQLSKVIARLIERGYTDFVSGIALGFDTWAAENVLEQKKNNKAITLECAIPCPQQADDWSREDQKRRKQIIRHSTSHVTTGNYPSRENFFKRNRYMVDKAEVVVCAYDGQKGGTGYTVDYALRNDKIVIQINPQTAKVSIISRRTFDDQ